MGGKYMKTIKFKKGIYRVNLPFLLNDFSPWQEQITTETKWMKLFYKVRKSARWDFEITRNGAMIVVFKS